MIPAITERYSIADRSEADRQEKDRIIQSLRSVIAAQIPGGIGTGFAIASVTASTAYPAVPFILKELLVPRTLGSTFDDACDPVFDALRKMTETEAFATLLRRYSYPDDVQIFVDSNGQLYSMIEGWRFTLSISRDSSGTLAGELERLGECAEQIGGYIYSHDVISVEQWLSFEGILLPKTVAETRNLIDFLTFKLPQSPALGDYHELLATAQDSPFHLTQDTRHTIKEVTLQLTNGKTSLLQKLAYDNFKLIPAITKRENADKLIERFLNSSSAKALGRAIHERLNWHLDLEDAQVSDRQLEQMAVAALLIDLNAQPDHHLIAGYDPYKPENAHHSIPQIREALEKHLVTQGLCEENVAPLAAHLMLARIAPELLIPDVPSDLALDKPGWVVVAQAVALIEAVEPGASRSMSFDRIKAFSEISPVSPEQATLHELTAIDPVVNWAVLNDIIPYSIDKQYDGATLNRATDYFNRYIDALNSSETALSSTPPDRRKCALAALRTVLPDGEYLEQKAFRFKYDESLAERGWLEVLKSALPLNAVEKLYDYSVSELGYSEYALSELLRMRFSPLDLYLSGDLVKNGALTEKFISHESFSPPAGAFARLGELEPVGKRFDEAFEAYYGRIQKGMTTIIKMAIANMPVRDRYALTNGHLTFYTVREEANLLNPSQETQRHRDEAKGRYGIIICCENRGTTRCYELFTLRGLCIARPDLVEILRSTGVMAEHPSLSYVGKKTDYRDKNRKKQWPLDFAAYREGSEPRIGRTSSVVVEKLWQLNLNAGDTQPVALFFSRHLDSVADLILEFHPVASREELYSQLDSQTELQEWRRTKEVIETAVINTLVPFKKCIEDIRSGDAERVSEGIGGCVLDGLAIIGLLVGLGASVASIVAKTGSTTLKVLSIAKAAARAALSLLNPIDGLPHLALKGLRLAKRGVLQLAEHGLDAIQSATQQLRKLTGSAQSYDLVKAAKLLDVKQGTWKVSEHLGQTIDLAVLERNGSQYALNLKVGGPWGPRLRNLKATGGFPFRNLFTRPKPFSFTRGYLTKAIPHAKSKLDNTIQLLADVENAEVRSVVKYLFGTNSDAAIDYLRNNLRVMRKDLDSLNFKNMSFRSQGTEAIAALKPETYKRWKAGIQSGKKLDETTTKFLVIYPEHLDNYYKTAKYDDARIGDTLVHEMSHGAPGTLDLYYGGVKPDAIPAEYDVVGLVELGRDARKAHPKNLANPHFGYAEVAHFDEFESNINIWPKVVQDHPALANAESYSVAVSLIDQHRTNPATFMFNLSTLQNAVDSTAPGKFLNGPLLLNLSKPMF